MSAPKLRFKEFAVGWKSFSLLDLSSDKTLNNGVFNDQNKVGKGYKLINVLDMYIDRDIDESRLSLLDLSKQEFERNKVKYGDIFFTRSSLVKEGIAYSNVYLGSSNDITYDGHLIKLSPNLEQINSIFLNYGLKTSKVRKQLIQGGKTATMTTIGQKEIASTKIDVPFLQEQTKIASFLSAVDEKISQLTQKHQLLSQYKQGMMQKLFSQQIRFKADDGSEFGEWDEYSLDTLLSKIIDNRGKTPVTEANLEIPLIEVNAIGQRRIKYEKVSKYFSEDTFQNWFRAYLEHQDILFSTVGNTAICSIYTDEIKAGIAQNIVGLRANTKLIQPTFLYYLLTEISNNQKFKSIEMQAVQPSIKVSQMIHLTFLTPCLEEQTKIANFLSSIDQKIEVTAQQIEQAKQWKKGLLQQMFV